MCNLIIIALVMLASGALGGLVNFFLADPIDESPLSWQKHMTVGIAAAFMVPLFLNMISGDLIDKIQGTAQSPSDYSKLFVLAGFCLVAAVSSRAFIHSMSERILQQVKSANKKASEAKEDAADAKAAVAPLVEEDESDDVDALVVPSDTVDKNSNVDVEEITLKAMTNSSYSLRSISGISKETGLPKAFVNAALSSLISKGFVSQSLNSKGQLRWFATQEGRAKSSSKP